VSVNTCLPGLPGADVAMTGSGFHGFHGLTRIFFKNYYYFSFNPCPAAPDNLRYPCSINIAAPLREINDASLLINHP